MLDEGHLGHPRQLLSTNKRVTACRMDVAGGGKAAMPMRGAVSPKDLIPQPMEAIQNEPISCPFQS